MPAQLQCFFKRRPPGPWFLQNHWLSEMGALVNPSCMMHCELYFPGYEERACVDSSTQHFCLTKWDAARYAEHWVGFDLWVSPEQCAAIYAFCAQHQGAWFSQARLLLYPFLKCIAYHENYWASGSMPSSWTCSTLTNTALTAAPNIYRQSRFTVQTGNVSPGDLYECMQQQHPSEFDIAVTPIVLTNYSDFSSYSNSSSEQASIPLSETTATSKQYSALQRHTTTTTQQQ